MGNAAVVLNDEMIKLISQTAATTAIEQYKKEQDLLCQYKESLLRNYRKFVR